MCLSITGINEIFLVESIVVGYRTNYNYSKEKNAK